VLREESPNVEILHAVSMPNEMLGGTLAEAEHQQPITVTTSRLRASLEKFSQIFDGQVRQSFQITGIDKLERTRRNIRQRGVVLLLGSFSETPGNEPAPIPRTARRISTR
jgi:hypothetical protein